MTEVLDKLQVDLINIGIKLDGKYVWIQHQKDDSSKFSMLYTLKNNKDSEIVYYIKHFICYLGVSKILIYNQGQEFKDAIFVFLEIHNMKRMNGCPCT